MPVSEVPGPNTLAVTIPRMKAKFPCHKVSNCWQLKEVSALFHSEVIRHTNGWYRRNAVSPDWIVRADPLYVDWGPRGRIVDTGRTGNTLVKRALIERTGLRFDPALGTTGGEDTEFFRVLGRAGAVMVVTDDAHIFEEAPADRLCRYYLRRRSLRKGQSFARYKLQDIGASAVARAIFYGDAALKALLAGAGSVLVWPFDRASSLRLALLGWMNAGKLREMTGLPPPRMY